MAAGTTIQVNTVPVNLNPNMLPRPRNDTRLQWSR
jgi:hypothetical protein